VNATFYGKVSSRLAASWRRRVSPEFTFTVKCHRDVTHTHRLRACEESYRAFEECLRVCEILEAPLLVLETPKSLKITGTLLREYFSSVDLRGVRAALEPRGETSEDAYRAMQDLGIIHVADLSVAQPRYQSDIAYSRLFGRGVHNIYQFDDSELREIDEKAAKLEAKRIFLGFHGIKMYSDAARLKRFRATGKFPKATSSTGLDSLRTVLQEDSRFPASKMQLLQHQGWKVVDLNENERVHAQVLLSRLDERTYLDVEDVIGNLASKGLATSC